MRDRSSQGKSLHAVFFVAALLAACGASDSAPETLMPGPNEILIGNTLTFNPAHLTVTAGTTVRWMDVGPFDHTVTSGASSVAADAPGTDFDTPMSPGKTFEVRFDALGDHPFFCRPHESMGMKGIITVIAPPAADAGTDADGGGD